MDGPLSMHQQLYFKIIVFPLFILSMFFKFPWRYEAMLLVKLGLFFPQIFNALYHQAYMDTIILVGFLDTCRYLVDTCRYPNRNPNRNPNPTLDFI